MHLVVDLGRLNWPPVVPADICANRVGWFVPTRTKETVVLYETTLTRELADRYRAAGWWPDRLLNDAVAEAIAQHPGRTALVDSRGRMTYAELAQQADQCALGLLVLGVRHGDV